MPALVTHQPRRSALLALLALGAHAAALAAPAPRLAAQMPVTDIHLLELHRDGDRLALGAPRNVTDRAGYDNQPWFLPGGEALLYVSERDGQTEVFRLPLADGKAGTAVRLTRTPQNEFSPTLTADGGTLLVVRWEADMSTGALWEYEPDGAPRRRSPASVPRVGYYTPAGDGFAFFVNDSVQSFVLAHASGGAVRVGDDLGGSPPRTTPDGRAVTFLRRGADDARWLTRLDLEQRVTTPLVAMPEDVVNYAWTPWGTVLAPRRNELLEWAPGTTAWRVVARFDAPALQAISRVAISAAGDRIALVAARPGG
jgi:hypothetical protein